MEPYLTGLDIFLFVGNVSARKLAKAVGISPSALSRIRQGITEWSDVDAETRAALSEHLGISETALGRRLSPYTVVWSLENFFAASVDTSTAVDSKPHPLAAKSQRKKEHG